MAHMVILGAGLAGMSAAFELREMLEKNHRITVIGDGDRFSFTPSNPWVAVGWRTEAEMSFAATEYLAKKKIQFITQPAAKILADQKIVVTVDQQKIDYDYLIIATGPKLAFEEISGLGPEAGFTQSICTTAHAIKAWHAYQDFLANPGPIVIGAVPMASCFGPAYEFAMILDTDLRKRKLRDQVPMTFVTSEPYLGHMGLGGVGDSKGLMEAEFRQRHIKWISNAKIESVTSTSISLSEYDEKAAPYQHHELNFNYAMLLPAFRGVSAVANVEGLCNPRGFVLVDKHQRSVKYPEIFAAGVCVAIPPVESTPIATGAPKTGFMIESMVSTVVKNIAAELAGEKATAEGTWNAVCLADMGDKGVAFVALPQFPPRNVTWAKKGRWVHLAKIAFEKYFLYKMRHGTSEPVYEKYVLKALGIERLKQEKK